MRDDVDSLIVQVEEAKYALPCGQKWSVARVNVGVKLKMFRQLVTMHETAQGAFIAVRDGGYLIVTVGYL